MGPEDLPALAAIDAASSASPWTEPQFQAELSKDISRFWTLRAGGSPRGFAGIWLVDGEAQLANIALSPDVRRRGWGRLLLRFLEERARALGAVRMTLEVREGNRAARRLYESQGFLETFRRPRYYEGRETAILMEKKL